MSLITTIFEELSFKEQVENATTFYLIPQMKETKKLKKGKIWTPVATIPAHSSQYANMMDALRAAKQKPMQQVLIHGGTKLIVVDTSPDHVLLIKYIYEITRPK